MAGQLIRDDRSADLSEEDRALCTYARKLTLTPGEMNEADVERMRAHGFDDDAITIAAQVIAYFNYINRIADGLGVEPEAWMLEPDREAWLARRSAAAT